jgi:type IV pilus assembly protein PilB
MVTLSDVGLQKVRNGEVSLDEVLKKTTITKESFPADLVNPDLEEYHDKNIIIREGNTDIDFFKLVQGSVYVVKGGKKIAKIVQPGEYFGEISVITGESRSASIVAKSRSKIKRFPGDKLQEVIEKYPDAEKHLFGVLAGQFYKTGKMFVNMLKQMKRSNTLGK